MEKCEEEDELFPIIGVLAIQSGDAMNPRWLKLASYLRPFHKNKTIWWQCWSCNNPGAYLLDQLSCRWQAARRQFEPLIVRYLRGGGLINLVQEQCALRKASLAPKRKRFHCLRHQQVSSNSPKSDETSDRAP